MFRKATNWTQFRRNTCEHMTLLYFWRVCQMQRCGGCVCTVQVAVNLCSLLMFHHNHKLGAVRCPVEKDNQEQLRRCLKCKQERERKRDERTFSKTPLLLQSFAVTRPSNTILCTVYSIFTIQAANELIWLNIRQHNLINLNIK